MTQRPAIALTDAEPEAWRGENRPGPSEHEAAVILAAKRFAQLDDELLNYAGARSGADYDRLLADWRASRTVLVTAALKGER